MFALPKHTQANKQMTAPPIVNEVLRAPGQPLDKRTRDDMKSRFGYDFSHVRVHTDARASDSASALHAAAYTLGHRIVFGADAFAPATPRGRRLLAHELTHVVQQQSASVPAIAQGSPLTVGAPGDRAEREADRVAAAFNQSDSIMPIVERPGARLARAPLDLNAISSDTQNLAQATVQIGDAPVRPMAVLYFKYNGHATGEVAKAADYPTTFTVPADKSK
jgi:hypothetical protein